jgi:hypothetical protein
MEQTQVLQTKQNKSLLLYPNFPEC